MSCQSFRIASFLTSVRKISEPYKKIKRVDWIKTAVGYQRECRAMIVGWETMQTAIHQHIGAFNDLVKQKGTRSPNNHMAVIAAKRQILAIIFEIHATIKKWKFKLRSLKIDVSAFFGVGGSFKKVFKELRKWNKIRNLTAHCADVSEPADHLIELYEAIDRITVKSINQVWKGIIQCGQCLYKVVVQEEANQGSNLPLAPHSP